MRNGPVQQKSFAFALEIVKAGRTLIEAKKEFILSRQLIRSGTAIGALIREAEQAESKPDFIHKMAIALKEAQETEYWLDLLHQSELIDCSVFESQNIELLKLITAIIKSSRT